MSSLMKPSTDDSPDMIILGILLVYILFVGLFVYLYFLHRISILPTIIILLIFTILYTPRFKIINKIHNKNDIKVDETRIYINNQSVEFSKILDYKIIEKNPIAIFFISNEMIVFNEAEVHLKTTNGEIMFTVIGNQKIKLLKEFLKLAFS